MTFCQQCGSNIQETDKFCIKCGTKVKEKILTPNKVVNPCVNEDNERILNEMVSKSPLKYFQRMVNTEVRIFKSDELVRPCHAYNQYCPYGQELVEEFPISEVERQYSCKIFGNDCPAYYLAEPFVENMSYEFTEEDNFGQSDAQARLWDITITGNTMTSKRKENYYRILTKNLKD